MVGGADLANTSLGWHVASGREMIARGEVLRADPFTFTAEGTPWIDHEWLFQVAVAGLDATFGEPGLVVLQALLVAAVAASLAAFARAAGLGPAMVALVTALCVYGAHIRLYLRPELCTLLVVAWAVKLVLDQAERPTLRLGPWLLGPAGLVALGVNLHGGVLILLPLLTGVLGARALGRLATPQEAVAEATRGAAVVVATAAAACLNPWGWAVFTVPLRLMELVRLPQVPNPEWISPGPFDLPSLYVGMALAALLLAAAERQPMRWALALLTAALAVRYVRNVGFFFVLLPLAVGPALARLRRLAARLERTRWLTPAVAAAALLAVAVAVAGDPRSTYTLSLADGWYPRRACVFLEQTGLRAGRLYNDVRFGGYLLYRYYPPHQVFIDDRNEVHEPLLTEIYDIYQTSDAGAFSDLLARHGLDTALIRYNPPFEVQSPSGEHLGWRGYSALWFPEREWALLYWDDVAMVLVRRSSEAAARLANLEYRAIRPDDLAWLRGRLANDPALALPLAAEAARKLADEPDCQRAREVASWLVPAVAP